MAAEPREVGANATFKTMERDEEGPGYACDVISTFMLATEPGYYLDRSCTANSNVTIGKVYAL
jgi:hypothetical protein